MYDVERRHLTRCRAPEFRQGTDDGSVCTLPTFAQRTTHRVLANGIIIDVIENHALPTVAIQGLVRAGRMDAPAGKPAIPGLTATMLNRGTLTADKRAIAPQ